MAVRASAVVLASGALLAAWGCAPGPRAAPDAATPSAPSQPPADVHDGRTVIEWAAVLKDGHAEERARAASVLERVAKKAVWEVPRSVEFDAAVPTLVAVLRDGDRASRQVAALALRVAGPTATEAVPALRDALAVEHAAFQRILETRGGGFFNEEAILRMRLVDALGAIGPDAKPALPLLFELVRTGDDKGGFRSTLLSAILQIDPTGEEAIPVYEGWLRGSAPGVGAHMLCATAESRSARGKLNVQRLRRSIPLLEQIANADDPSFPRREAEDAVKAIRRIPE